MKKQTTLTKVFYAALLIFAGACSTKIDFRNDIIRTATLTVILAPNSDTTTELKLATGSVTYDVDSLIQHSTHTNPGGFDINQLVTAKINACFVNIVQHGLTDDLSNFQSCSISCYTDIEPTPKIASLPFISDAIAYQSVFTTSPSENLKNYLINTNGSHVKTFHYTFSGKLRRPLEDTLRCDIKIDLKLHLEKTEVVHSKASDYIPHK